MDQPCLRIVRICRDSPQLADVVWIWNENRRCVVVDSRTNQLTRGKSTGLWFFIIGVFTSSSHHLNCASAPLSVWPMSDMTQLDESSAKVRGDRSTVYPVPSAVSRQTSCLSERHSRPRYIGNDSVSCLNIVSGYC
jgi:hypothetical protein